ncbi:metal-dependent transcriptional regulator [Solicola gregarius]|uniref:Manganese transport regulator n=1 Tax=Solicola gregarius TaxID=2908642 RepID=A0AA46YKZ5_9ACTN|nr:metal-dependent transcriptional regulator [Solicola gregarius]UYM05021.1 metal-dependent transcriptional regulator [Solicola gregarius]
MKSQRPTATEDYLKVIFALGEWGPAPSSGATSSVTTSVVAARLGLSASSVSEMVRKLAALDLVRHERYGAITLTAQGRTEALQVLRRHRLIETYLVRALDYSWDEVHDEAEVLEHAVSARMIERMDAALGHPWRDPHGDPIPTAEGVIHQPPARRLTDLAEEESGYLARIADDDPQLLRSLSERGLALDDRAVRRGRHRLAGATEVEFHHRGRRTRVELGDDALAALWVTEAPPLSVTSGDCPYVGCVHLEAG